jgi:class 3 adenylate cyclase
VEFTIELERILHRFGAQWGAPLRLRAGIDLGQVTSGLIGRAHMVYDLWGDAVDLAFLVQGGHEDAGVFLTQRVLDSVPGTIQVASAGSIQTPNGEEQVWRVIPNGDHG